MALVPFPGLENIIADNLMKLFRLKVRRGADGVRIVSDLIKCVRNLFGGRGCGPVRKALAQHV